MKLLFYVYVRNSYLTLFAHRLSKIVNTILIINIPKKDLSILKNIYDIFLDKIYFVWINRDLLTLLKKIQERKTLVITLEIAKTSFILLATKSFRQRKSYELAQSNKTNIKKKRSLWRRYLKKKNRNYMYISRQICNWMPTIPLIEKRINIIYHYLDELTRMNKEIKIELTKLVKIESNKRELSKYLRMKFVFIRFNT